MPKYSTFQALPLHIMDDIGFYLLGSYQYQLDWPKPNDDYYRILSTLYNISSTWRELARGYLYRVVKLQSNESNVYCWKFSCQPESCTSYCAKDPNSYARKAYILINMSDLLLKRKGVRRIRLGWKTSHLFSSVRRVLIDFQDDTEELACGKVEATDDVLFEVVNGVLKNMPNAQDIRIGSKSYTVINKIGEAPPDFDEPVYEQMDGSNSVYSDQACIACCMDRTLSVVIPNVKKLGVGVGCMWLIKDMSYMRNGTGLTSLVYAGDTRVALFRPLVTKSAATLISLEIKNCFQNIIADIVLDKSGVIIYPQLRRLQLLFVDVRDKVSKLTIDKSIVPFPLLKHIDFYSPMFVEDNTMFRGAGALSYLRVTVDHETLKLAGEGKLYKVGHYKEFVRLTVLLAYGMYFDPELELYERYIFDLVSLATRVLVISGLRSSQSFISAIPKYPQMTNLQLLDMHDVKMTLADIISLLGLLPKLTKIFCDLQDLGDEINSIGHKSLPKRLYSKYYPLSRWFRCLGVSTHSCYIPHKTLAISALLLAILCPRFTGVDWISHCYMDFYDGYDNSEPDDMFNHLESDDEFNSADSDSKTRYYREMVKAIKTKSFSEYAEQTRHLLKRKQL
ncbi:hypothetical protein GGI25_004967 [Coemansia spiralis]|uniref:Uncharacterized protein n=2 Tax=Coemansia TaxID=4863 RepID=A0A9W8G4N1_9FUNG|nr:hypothetical protein EDC05_004875 [Coemansia umbellata]KAJ2620101.1 hypothetical protein GGI26_005273 [Coemansia sp. RSA 1358]KAJ2672772.1 hypothetical protein GGI25_004967 [Coemansia spiralis]